MKLTESLCPVCYKRIPAIIYEDSNVMMLKECKEHGVFTSMIERDPLYYKLCSGNIYDGYLIDITSKCNLKCKYCYHDNSGEDRIMGDILYEALKNKSKAPFILTGGEPTLNQYLPKIIKSLSSIGEVNLLTNGIKLCDETYLNELLESGLLLEGGILNISLSLHKESNGKDIEFLEYCLRKGYKLWTLLYVIDDLRQIDDALRIFQTYRATSMNFRIKAASNLWAEGKSENKIFTSDMIHYLGSIDEIQFHDNQKASYAQVLFRGLDIRLISWYDVNNVDLWDIDCAPYYKSQDGTVNNLVTSCLINEGISKKTGINVRRAYPCDIPICARLWKDGAIEEQGVENPRVDIWMEQAYEFISHENNHLYVAEYNGEIVGFVSGFWHVEPLFGDKMITGTHFYVKPEYRKTGVGKAMQIKYMKVGSDLGITRSERRVTQEHSKVLLGKGQKMTHVIIEEPIKEVLCQ